MHSLIAPALVAMATASLAATVAAAPAAKPAEANPKPAVAAPVHPGSAGSTARPKLQTPVDTASAMTRTDRLSLQADLAWIGVYNGLIDGEPSSRMVAAIKAFQKSRNGKPTGVLNP